MINPKDLLQKTPDELVRLVRDLGAQVRDLRFKITTRQVVKVRDLRNAKRDLARVQTALQVKTQSSSQK